MFFCILFLLRRCPRSLDLFRGEEYSILTFTVENQSQVRQNRLLKRNYSQISRCFLHIFINIIVIHMQIPSLSNRTENRSLAHTLLASISFASCNQIMTYFSFVWSTRSSRTPRSWWRPCPGEDDRRQDLRIETRTYLRTTPLYLLLPWVCCDMVEPPIHPDSRLADSHAHGCGCWRPPTVEREDLKCLHCLKGVPHSDRFGRKFVFPLLRSTHQISFTDTVFGWRRARDRECFRTVSRSGVHQSAPRPRRSKGDPSFAYMNALGQA